MTVDLEHPTLAVLHTQDTLHCVRAPPRVAHAACASLAEAQMSARDQDVRVLAHQASDAGVGIADVVGGGDGGHWVSGMAATVGL